MCPGALSPINTRIPNILEDFHMILKNNHKATDVFYSASHALETDALCLPVTEKTVSFFKHSHIRIKHILDLNNLTLKISGI